MENNNEVQVVNNTTTTAIDFIPVAEMQKWYNQFVEFSKSILKESLDYGVIPGVQKPSLFKPGAEKLRFAYGLGVGMKLIDKTEDLNKNFLDYTYKASVYTKSGQLIAECEGNCNTYEPKFRYVWIDTDLRPAKEEGERLKAEKKGRWRKYGDRFIWQIKTDVSDVFGIKNTIMKMAQKRAFVGAILMATGASEFFTQDVEDLVAYNKAIISDVPIVQTPVNTTSQEVKENNNDLLKDLSDKIINAKSEKELKEIAQLIKSQKSKLNTMTHTKLLQTYSKKLSEIKGEIKNEK